MRVLSGTKGLDRGLPSRPTQELMKNMAFSASDRASVGDRVVASRKLVVIVPSLRRRSAVALTAVLPDTSTLIPRSLTCGCGR